jgi:integrase/recombinase XerC
MPAVIEVPAIGDLGALASSFRRSLRAQNKSPRTVQGYLEGVEQFGAFLVAHVEAFVDDQLIRFKPSTAQTRYRSLQQFFKWLAEEGEIRSSPMVNMKPPGCSGCFSQSRVAADEVAMG